jgi:WD40 repeat protein
MAYIVFFMCGPSASAQPAQINEWMLLDVREMVHGVAFSADGKLLAACLNHRTEIWSLTDKSKKCVINDRGTMCFTNQDTELTVGTYFIEGSKLKDGERRGTVVRRWDLASGNLSEETKFHDEFAWPLSGAGSVLISRSADSKKTANVLDLTTRKKVRITADEDFDSVFMCPQKKTIVSLHTVGEFEAAMRIWDFPSGKLRHSVALKDPKMYWSRQWDTPGVFSADGRVFQLVFPHNEYELWDLRTGKPTLTEPHRVGYSRKYLHLFPNGKLVLQGGIPDGDVLIFDAQKRVDPKKAWEPVARLHGTKRAINLPCIAVSADGKLVAQSTSNGTISIWKVPSLDPAPK